MQEKECLCPKCGVVKTKENSFMRPDRPNNYQAYCKSCNNRNVLMRQRQFKKICVDYKGGKCIKCGYDKCIAGLEFHHRDPSQKDFTIGQNKNYSEECMKNKIYPELDKCDLVCRNCHAEIHFIGLPQEPIIKKPLKEYFCKDCNRTLTNNSERCTKCYGKIRFSGPSKEQLIQDNIDFKNNFCAIGRKYNVTDNSVRKWFKRFDLNLD